MTRIPDAAAELFLGSDIEAAMAQGPRHFRSAAKAVRFAMEQAAPVSLRGALLKIGERHLHPAEIRRLHGALAGAEEITLADMDGWEAVSP